MSERLISASEERVPEGQEIYVNSMELSAEAKIAEILPWVKKGLIGDFGAGSGPVIAKLSSILPESEFVGLDFSHDMVVRMASRFAGNPKISVVEADVTSFQSERKFDTILHISNLHEVFSFNGYNHAAVLRTLANDLGNLNKGGRLVIRDGVQPEHEELYLKPLTEFACDRFLKFVDGFTGVRKVNFMTGSFLSDVFVQTGRRSFTSADINNSLIEISSQNASEMFSKYFYPEVNLPVELQEQFGIWTLREYSSALRSLGFTVVYAETFLLDYLKNEHYSRDWEVYHLENGVLTKASYPPSTMLLVAEKN